MSITIEKYPDGSIYLAGTGSDEFLQAIAQKGAEGYVVLQGCTQLHMHIKRCVLGLKEPLKVVDKPEQSMQASDKPEQEVHVPDNCDAEVSQEVIKSKAKYSQAIVSSFKGNKDKLEKYGRELGVELKKSKSFDNMVKDLEDSVSFPY